MNRKNLLLNPISLTVAAILMSINTMDAASEEVDTPGQRDFSTKTDVVFSGTPDQLEDGDSFWIGIHKIRLYGIDAFEPDQTCDEKKEKPIQCGQLSLEHLSSLAQRGEFVCTVHKGKAGKPWINYGRYVSTCLVNGENIGRKMVEAGWAVPANHPSGASFEPARKAAEINKLGAHAAKSFLDPWEWRKHRRGNRCGSEDP